MDSQLVAKFRRWVDRRIYYAGDNQDILLVKRIWWVCLIFAFIAKLLLTLLFYHLYQPELAFFFFLGALYWLFSFVMAWMMGGIMESGGIIFLGLIAPVYAIVFPNRGRAILVFVLYLISLLILVGFDKVLVPIYPLQDLQNLHLFILNFIVSAIFWFIAIYFFSLKGPEH